ncbi:MAG: hypothetical protein P4L53_05430 [Candidatus Obscuribacterales bacterium]|nr:hypothetical protein [Candidatus Obscuribacterales bacterium]
MSSLEHQEQTKGGNAAADFSSVKLFHDSYDKRIVTAAEAHPVNGVSEHVADINEKLFTGAYDAAPKQAGGLWSNFRATASEDCNWLLQASSNLESSLTESVRSNFGAGQSAEDLFSKATTYAEEHPVAAVGYTIGAIAGGAFAVTTGAALAPVELGVGVTLAVAATGAAAVDGGAYVVQELGQWMLDA